jgi:hypothetical protein
MDLPFVFRDAADVRTAFTAAFLTLYLAFVDAAFNNLVTEAFRAQGSFLHSVGDNLNTLMIAIVGFYFGGKAVETTAAIRIPKRSNSGDISAGEREDH